MWDHALKLPKCPFYRLKRHTTGSQFCQPQVSFILLKIIKDSKELTLENSRKYKNPFHQISGQRCNHMSHNHWKTSLYAHEKIRMKKTMSQYCYENNSDLIGPQNDLRNSQGSPNHIWRIIGLLKDTFFPFRGSNYRFHSHTLDFPTNNINLKTLSLPF